MILLNKVPFSPYIFLESVEKIEVLTHSINPEYKEFLPCCYLFALANTFNSKAFFKVAIKKELINVVSPYYENKYLTTARKFDLSNIPDVHVCDYYVDNSDVYKHDFDLVKVMNIFHSEPPAGENICFLVSLLEKRSDDEVSMHRILIVKNSQKEFFLVDSALPKVLLLNEKELLGIFLQYTAVNCISTFNNTQTGIPCLFKDKDLKHITSRIIH